MRKKTLIAALLSLSAAAVSLNLFSQGTSIVTPAGSNPTITAGFSKAGQDAAETITLNPVEDAYITQTTSDNYGSANELMVKMAYKEEHAATRITYLKFDFRSENLDSSDINNAKLRLFCTVNNVAAPVINVHGASDDNWTESDINGTNEPSRGIVLSSTTITAAGQYYEWDVSSFVASEANGDDIVSLVVFKSGNESNVNFASREATANRPELLITKSGSGETGDHTITASAGPNGTITPNGVVAVAEGLDQVFIITPDPGYSIEDVVVDGASEGAVASYTFTNVTTDHTIAAGFVPGGQYYTITATAGLNGSISPEGAISVNEASDQTFSIMADAGYEIADVLIDGISAGPLTTYTFFFVTADHTVEAIFTPHSDTGSSQLWGVQGEKWDPAGPLKDFTGAGYRNGNESIPHWPIGVYVTDFGAFGEDEIDDTHAFIQALNSCPQGSAVYIPLGRYIITEQISFNRDSVVLRGEDMYETVLYFPFGLKEIDPTIDSTRLPYEYGLLDVNGIDSKTSSHRSLENFTIEFREEQNLGHWSNLGTNAIDLSGVSDCWVRNIRILNANNGITLYAKNVTILDIVFDNFEGRVGDQSEGYAGHQGIKINSEYNLVHHVEFRADDYEHTVSFNNSGRYNVISRVSSQDMQLDDHGGNTGYNLFTEIDLGEGTPEVGRQTYRGAHDFSVFWNIQAERDQPYREVFNERQGTFQGADINYQNTVVGLKTNLPDDITMEYWHERIDPTILQPQNIYIAQLHKNGKELPASFDHTLNPERFNITASCDSNGSITPPGTVSLLEGFDQTYTITADSGYVIADVLVDGVSVGAVSSHTFIDINADHTITAGFTQDTTGTTSFFQNGTQAPLSFVIFPNPAKGHMHISGIDATARVRVFDVAGRERIAAEAGNSSVLDVSFLKPGIYIIEVSEADICEVKRFIKQ